MASIKQSLSRYRQWQQNSKLHIAQPSNVQHYCHCCDSEFSGNFCPQCGQKAGDKHITWSSISAGVMDLWGMGTRSLPYTLWQLMLRPGYLIGDYISGRRQMSFPPIKMLVFVALFVFLVTSILFPEDLTESSGDEFVMMDSAINFFENHYDVGMMFFFSLLIIPTYFIFRFAPRCDHHTLPEGFFIQVFNSTTALIFLLPITFFNYLNSNYYPLLLLLVVVFVLYRSYYQLFGYSHWATLWRTMAVCISAGLTLGMIVVIDFLTFLVKEGNYDRALRNIAHRFIPYFSVALIIIAASYYISRHTSKHSGTNGAG